MKNLKKSRWASWLLAGLLMSVAFPASPAQASDGQLLGGDSNIASNVVDAGSTARVTFDASSVIKDCPTGLSGCTVEYRWRSRKDCAICWWSNDTGWIVLPSGGPTLNHCKADGNYRFELQIRYRWWASATKTVRGEAGYESQLKIDVGGVISKAIPKGLFNVSNNTGWKGSYTLETATAVDDYSNPYTIATSGSSYISTDC